MVVDNLDDLFKIIDEIIQDTVSNEVDTISKKELSKQIDQMYNEYTPSKYVRRYHGMNGFGDASVLYSTIKSQGEGVDYNLENRARAVGDDWLELLAPFIEYGFYSWRRHPAPRPVFARTYDALRNGNKVESAIKEGLKRNGLM